MKVLLFLFFAMVAAAGFFVVRSRDPRRQSFALAANGLALSLLFFALQAPDVALSELVVGTAATPLLFLVALAATRTNRSRRQR